MSKDVSDALGIGYLSFGPYLVIRLFEHSGILPEFPVTRFDRQMPYRLDVASYHGVETPIVEVGSRPTTKPPTR